jgi:hypothetical protein
MTLRIVARHGAAALAANFLSLRSFSIHAENGGFPELRPELVANTLSWLLRGSVGRALGLPDRPSWNAEHRDAGGHIVDDDGV